MPGMHVQSLIWEDRTCCRATKLMSHNYRACAVEPTSWGHWSPCAPQQEKPPQREAHALQLESSPCLWQLEKALVQQWRRRAAKKERKLQVKIITHQQTQEIYNAWKVLGKKLNQDSPTWKVNQKKGLRNGVVIVKDQGDPCQEMWVEVSKC